MTDQATFEQRMAEAAKRAGIGEFPPHNGGEPRDERIFRHGAGWAQHDLLTLTPARLDRAARALHALRETALPFERESSRWQATLRRRALAALTAVGFIGSEELAESLPAQGDDDGTLVRGQAFEDRDPRERRGGLPRVLWVLDPPSGAKDRVALATSRGQTTFVQLARLRSKAFIRRGDLDRDVEQ